MAARTVSIGEKPVELSKLEFDLLLTLSGEPKRVFTKRELWRDVWGMPDGVTTRTLDSHACRLRRKLVDAGAAGFVTNR